MTYAKFWVSNSQEMEIMLKNRFFGSRGLFSHNSIDFGREIASSTQLSILLDIDSHGR